MNPTTSVCLTIGDRTSTEGHHPGLHSSTGESCFPDEQRACSGSGSRKEAGDVGMGIAKGSQAGLDAGQTAKRSLGKKVHLWLRGGGYAGERANR